MRHAVPHGRSGVESFQCMEHGELVAVSYSMKKVYMINHRRHLNARVDQALTTAYGNKTRCCEKQSASSCR